MRKRRSVFMELMESGGCSSDDEEDCADNQNKKSRRGGWGRTPRMGDTHSEIKHERWLWPSHNSIWLRMINDASVRNERTVPGMKFRGRFRVPFKVFSYLLKQTREHGDFEKSGRRGKGGARRHPLELKILASLRVFAKGCDFDTVSEIALISPTCLERFHWRWCQFLVDHLLKEWVRWPSDEMALGYMGELHHLYSLGSLFCCRLEPLLAFCPQKNGDSSASLELYAPLTGCIVHGRGALSA